MGDCGGIGNYGIREKNIKGYSLPSLKKSIIVRFIKYARRTLMQVNKEMIIGELLRVDAGIAPILMGAGMHCLG